MRVWLTAFFIGCRYARSKKRNRFISFIGFISIIGIALGVAVIITVLSVMNGFREEIRTRLLDFTAHATIGSFVGQIKDWEAIAGQALAVRGVAASAPFVELQVLLSAQRGRSSGAYVRGILPDEELQIGGLGNYVDKDSLHALQTGSYRILLGHSLARRLAVEAGDKIIAIVPERTHTPAGIIPLMRSFKVSGTFKIGMQQFDNHVALVHLNDAQKLSRYDNEVSAVQLRYDDVFSAPLISRIINERLSADYYVKDWTQQHKNFFQAIELEKKILFVILTLIVIVAVFNIVSALVMVVVEKRGDIAVLKTVGMKPAAVLFTFVVQGCLLGFVGSVFGVIGGVTLSHYLPEIADLIERFSGSRFLDPSVYPITEVPSLLLGSDIALVSGMAFFLTVLATLYPAWKAAKVSPSEALRYE